MHQTCLIHSRIWVVLAALAIILSGKSQEPFGIDELYGVLD